MYLTTTFFRKNLRTLYHLDTFSLYFIEILSLYLITLSLYKVQLIKVLVVFLKRNFLNYIL